ncbi:MAG: iron uptake system EfeUOB component EfeO/EfeM [Arenicella sp.]|jgi:iron uptake system EfeUOB component EfeO/EfeM
MNFARSLLDSARNSEISDERHHFEKIHLLFAMDDEGGFQQCYDEIRPNLERFDKDVVARTEGLVTSIKQEH